MKKHFHKSRFSFLTIIFCLFISFGTFAQAVVRVTAGMNLQTEITNAAPGTVFLVEHTSGNSITINKQVYIIGTGYKLGQPRTEVNEIRLVAGSDNSVITGMTISDNIYITADNITIKRNLVHGNIDVGETSGGSYVQVSNCVIKQNYIEANVLLSNSTTGKRSVNNIIENNIIQGYLSINSIPTGIVKNNTILTLNFCQSFGSDYELVMVNNIIYSTCTYSTNSYPNGRYPTNNYFVHNIIRNTQFITNEPSNIKLTDFSNEFTGFPNFSGTLLDARFQLKSTSVAKGAGLGGVDCGAFGGPDPYVLDGIPEGPNIISVNAPSGAAAGQTITVNIQAVNQN